MDRTALTRALRPLLPELTRFCRWIHPEGGDDLVQDVVVRAIERCGEIREASRLRAWLFRTARNAWIDGRRSRAARERLVVLDGGVFESGEVPSVVRIPDERLDLERAIAAMPEVARTAVLLADLWQLSYGEIAEVMDVPTNTVRSRVARARVRLASALAAGLNPGRENGEESA